MRSAVTHRTLSKRVGATGLLLSFAVIICTLTACGGDGESCEEYRQYVSAGSAQDTRDIRNGNNPCY